MPITQKYSFFVYFETVFVYFETPWAMNRHFMSKKKRAHSGDLTLTVAALDDTTRRIENHPVNGKSLKQMTFDIVAFVFI